MTLQAQYSRGIDLRILQFFNLFAWCVTVKAAMDGPISSSFIVLQNAHAHKEFTEVLASLILSMYHNYLTYLFWAYLSTTPRRHTGEAGVEV